MDFGTESGRAALVDLSNGDVLATSVVRYPSAVIDQTLMVDGRRVGSLVLLGTHPRRPNRRHLRFLHQAAERAQAHLQLRYTRSRLREAEVALALARA